MIDSSYLVECFSSCKLRSELDLKQERCHPSCMACCRRCNCVPGQYGKREMCGSCYTDMKTLAGRPMCP